MLRVRDMSLYGHKGIRKALLGGAITLTLFLYGIVGINLPFVESTPATLEAQGVSQELRGYAWSDNIGWISFSCLDTASCNSVEYGVLLNSDSSLTGYAWSDNIGWIKFGGLSQFPSGNGSTALRSAFLNGSKLDGWARACAGTINGDCSTMTSRTDGWDGWIALSGSGISQAPDGNNPGGGNTVPTRGSGPETGGPFPVYTGGAAAIFNYGVSVDNGEFTGYAWGGDVVGWIDWKPFVDSADGCTSNCGGGGGCQGVCVSDPFDFDLDVPPAVQTDRGQTSQAIITTSLVSGFAENVTFSHGAVVGLSNLNFSQNSCNPDCSTTLSFTVDSDATYGLHPVVVTATSESGIVESKTLYINVPAPDITGDITCSADKSQVIEGQEVVWSAQVSSGASHTYVWSDATGQIGTGQSISKIYSTPGLKGVTVTVTDGGGATGECTATVTVKKRPVIEEF